jgi:RecJ-like exonuclease
MSGYSFGGDDPDADLPITRGAKAMTSIGVPGRTTISLDIDYRALVDGDEVEITTIAAIVTCESCHGTGRVDSPYGMMHCPTCSGKSTKVYPLNLGVLSKSERLHLEKDARERSRSIDRDNEEDRLRARDEANIKWVNDMRIAQDAFAEAKNDDGTRGGGTP